MVKSNLGAAKAHLLPATSCLCGLHQARFAVSYGIIRCSWYIYTLDPQPLKHACHLHVHCLQPRFVRLPTTSYFDGPTHELLVVDTDSDSTSSSSSSTHQLLEGVTFPRQPQQQDADTGNALLRQDEQLLQQYLTSGPPPPGTAARWNYYLEHTLQGLGDSAAAALAFQESALLAAASDEAAWAAYKAAESLHSSGFSSQAREILLAALGRDPPCLSSLGCWQ